MSTEKNNQALRIAKLAVMNERIFHTRDLANLWGINNKNTLYTTIKRYSKIGLLHRLYKGFLSLVPPDSIDQFELGAKALSRYSYLTTESVLYSHGYISQPPSIITFAGLKNQQISIGNRYYKCRQLQENFLFNPKGIKQEGNVLVATPERAIADMLYFKPTFHFDKEPDWATIKDIQEALGYPLTKQRYAFATTK